MDMEKLFSSVAMAFGTEAALIRASFRGREVADARKAIVYVLKKYHKINSSHIARLVNKKPCGMSYMFNQAEILIKSDSAFRMKISQIKVDNGLESMDCPHCGRPYEKACD